MKFSEQGWLDTATRIDTPNFNDDANARTIIVMHYTAGYTAASAIATFKNPASEASAHFIVGTNGAITQMVATRHVAWHSGFGLYQGRRNVNGFAIGIEIVNPGYHFRNPAGGFLNWDKKPVTAAQLAPFPGMVEARDAWVGSAPVFWPRYPETQLRAVEQLTATLLKAYPTITDIVGHRDVDSERRRKVDPGPAFPMPRFKALITARNRDASTTTAIFVVKSDTGEVRVRSGPGTGFATLDWSPLGNGDQVERLSRDGDWLRIRRWVNGTPREGWVRADYLVAK
jgi:N-acetylmuramoyl-L-alanine amidase